MRTIFYDSDFKCHITNDGTMSAVETEAFDGKCDEWIEGHRFVPHDKTWIREDGEVFHGEMKSPYKPLEELSAAQAQYEADMAKLVAAYQEGVNSV